MKYLITFTLLFFAVSQGKVIAQDVLIPFRDGDKWGLADVEGNLKEETEYEEIRFSKFKGIAATGAGYCYVVKSNGYYGAMIGTEEVVRCKMKEVVIYQDIILALEQHGSYSVYNHYGEQLLNGEVDEHEIMVAEEREIPPLHIVTFINGKKGLFYLTASRELVWYTKNADKINVKASWEAGTQIGWKVCKIRSFIQTNVYYGFYHKEKVTSSACKSLIYKKSKRTYKILKRTETSRVTEPFENKPLNLNQKNLSTETPSDFSLEQNQPIVKKDIFLGASHVTDSSYKAKAAISHKSYSLLKSTDTIDYWSGQYTKWPSLSLYTYKFRPEEFAQYYIVGKEISGTLKYGVLGPNDTLLVPLEFDTLRNLVTQNGLSQFVFERGNKLYLYGMGGELLKSYGFDFLEFMDEYYIGYANGKSERFKVCLKDTTQVVCNSSKPKQSKFLILDKLTIADVSLELLADRDDGRLIGYISDDGTEYFVN